jgi:predicted site-specific integrase-resolvase
MSYVSSGKASEYYNVHPETLRDWANKSNVEFIKTKGGHRRYKIPEPECSDRKKYIYGRVSSRKQDGDLERQLKYLGKKYPDYEVIRDIGSGLNFKRQGFRKILEQLFDGNIEEVVISSCDRFSRFGTREFFVWLFEHFGGKLTILENRNYANPNEELSEDLLEIITVFSARYYGRRKYEQSSTKANNKKDKNLPEHGAEEAVQEVL